MTVTYTANVNTSKVISNFLKLLFRWRGSIYKLVWIDLIIFFGLYCLVALSYRTLMTENGQKVFEGIVYYCSTHGNLLPLSFVLGFYVSIVMGRWWQQYTTIPWPDSIAILVSSSIQGFDDRARAMRRTVLRYVCLCQVIVFTMISPNVKKRFPTYSQIIESGLLLENEKAIIENLDVAFPHYPKHWMPIVWAASIVMRARKENKIRDDYAVKTIIDELNKFRGYCGFLLYYDWVSVPLVYTQVVTLATYTFFLFSVIGQQWTQISDTGGEPNRVVQWFPFLTILQFFFYMGWLKVAESLINPFGEDDDDFELNWMIDRNLTVSYLIVDEMHQEHPELVKDQYWDEVFPNELPYAEDAKRTGPPEASTAKLDYNKANNSDQKRFYISRDSTSTNRSGRDNFLNHMLDRQSTSASFADYQHQTTKENNSRLTFHEPLVDSEEDKPRLRRPSRSESASLNFDELIEQRHQERRERMRHRFLNMRSTHTRSAPSGGYTVTVLRPPSEEALGEEEDA
ncbi:bestrophin-4 isoform X1 [Drosophila obscura]|uniref:bestrophin-4 isoform X1 n=1 Tax=Drosophila obscura TaxID=7282 RepID=UPI000BA18C00|nr:bestrophin-4 isoform X1 [Drosophila obscura]